MSLKIGIAGLPNVGKSTLFNALTKNSVSAENYPFCTIDPSVGIVPVPDSRLAQLCELSQSAETIPAVVEFVDIAGLVKGAAEGEGLGNKFLSHIREVDAIAQVVRVFEDDDITHVHGSVDPLHDIEVINLELILADLERVNKRLTNLEGDLKAGNPSASSGQGNQVKREYDVLERIKEALENERMAHTVVFEKDEKKLVRGLGLLTQKPMIYILNTKAGASNLTDQKNDQYEKLIAHIEGQGAAYVLVDAGVEQEVKELEGDEKEIFRKDLGASGEGLGALIRTGYALLDLITFFTTGEKETRAWTIQDGSTAPEAGAAIHTDFQEKFIRASIIAWDKLLTAGSYGRAREKGWVRTEGRDYIVQDGDVVEFKI